MVKGHGVFNSWTTTSKPFLHDKLSDEDNTKATSEDAVIHFADDEWMISIDIGTDNGKRTNQFSNDYNTKLRGDEKNLWPL